MSAHHDLELLGIGKNFGGTSVVNQLTLQIAKGEFVSLLGPSGCGKSTTLMMIAGFEDPTEGEIVVRGKRIDRLLPEQRNVGVVFQSYALFPHMSVRQNVEYGLRMRRVPRAQRRERSDRILELVHMHEFADRSPRQLSGGQQQRIALARALVTEPDILLLDEPFSALDRQLREDLQREVRLLQRSLGITTIFVTHDQEEALLMSDRVAVMNAGKVEQCAAPEALYKAPATEFVARFIGRGSFVDGVVARRDGGEVVVETPLGSVPGVAEKRSEGQAVRLFFRPEDVEVVANGDDPAPGLRINGGIKVVYFQGSSSLAEAQTAGLRQSILFDASRYVRHVSLREGDPISLSVPAHKLHVFP